MNGRSARLCAGFLLASIIGFAAAQAAPAAMPDVIAPEQLPQLKAVRADAGQPSLGNAPAPMPDVDAAAPVAAPSDDLHVVPAMFFQKVEFSGNGMTAGSADHARTQQPATGLALDVPLN